MIITDEALLRPVCKPVLPEEVEGLRHKLEGALRRSYELGKRL